MASDPRDLLIRKLESVRALSEFECDALCRLEGKELSVPTHYDIVRVGDQPGTVDLILVGFACRYVMLADGKRQITSFHIPGDIPCLESLLLSKVDENLCSLSPRRLFAIPHTAMLALFQKHPEIAALFWRETLIEASIFREWMVGLGRRSAYSRMAHLFCELIERMRAVGLAGDHELELPLTQADIGDALGLSTVHVNRTLQELRAKGLINLTRHKLVATDWHALRNAGQFERSYLHVGQKIGGLAKAVMP